MNQAVKYLEPLESLFLNAHDDTKASKMEQYMKGKAAFFGISSPDRANIFKIFISQNGLPAVDLLPAVIENLWAREKREYQYAGMNLVFKMRKQLTPMHLEMIESMILKKSWWDTVDFIAADITGFFMQQYPEMIHNAVDRWLHSDELWLQRTALLFQLKYKADTDDEMLKHIVINLANEKDFFIRKGIGWALREYSKTNAPFITQLVSDVPMSALSQKEAMRIILK